MADQPEPEFKKGEWVRIYCGPCEDHCFAIKAVRWDEERRRFMYLYDMGGWYSADSLVPASSRKGWHYDSEGYCDNPGRGY